MSSRRRWLARTQATPMLDFWKGSNEKNRIRLLLARKHNFHGHRRLDSQEQELLRGYRAEDISAALDCIKEKRNALLAELELAQALFWESYLRLGDEKAIARLARRRATTVANAQSCAAVERFFDAMGGHRVYIDVVRPWCLRAIRRPGIPRPRFEGQWLKCFQCNKIFTRTDSGSSTWFEVTGSVHYVHPSPICSCYCGHYFCFDHIDQHIRRSDDCVGGYRMRRRIAQNEGE